MSASGERGELEAVVTEWLDHHSQDVGIGRFERDDVIAEIVRRVAPLGEEAVRAVKAVAALPSKQQHVSKLTAAFLAEDVPLEVACQTAARLRGKVGEEVVKELKDAIGITGKRAATLYEAFLTKGKVIPLLTKEKMIEKEKKGEGEGEGCGEDDVESEEWVPKLVDGVTSVPGEDGLEIARGMWEASKTTHPHLLSHLSKVSILPLLSPLFELDAHIAANLLTTGLWKDGGRDGGRDGDHDDSDDVESKLITLLKKGSWGLGSAEVLQWMKIEKREWKQLLRVEVPALEDDWDGQDEGIMNALPSPQSTLPTVSRGHLYSDEVVNAALEGGSRGEWDEIFGSGKVLIRFAIGGCGDGSMVLPAPKKKDADDGSELDFEGEDEGEGEGGGGDEGGDEGGEGGRGEGDEDEGVYEEEMEGGGEAGGGEEKENGRGKEKGKEEEKETEKESKDPRMVLAMKKSLMRRKTEREWLWQGLWGKVMARRGSACWKVLGMEDLVGEIGSWLEPVAGGKVALERCAAAGCDEMVEAVLRWWRTDPTRTLTEGSVKEWTPTIAKALLVASRKYEDGKETCARALVDAAKDCKKEVVLAMIEGGVDVKYANHNNDTALIWVSASRDDPDLVRALIEAGAEINQQNVHSHTPLTLAASKGHVDTLKVLLDAGADPHKLTANNDTALTWAVEGGVEEEVVKVLIDAGVDVHQANSHGHTALTLAARRGSPAIVKMLLDAGADVSVTTEKQDTALGWACAGQSTECVRLLVEAGSDINHTNVHEHTPLTLAACKGTDESIHLLLEAGANPHHITQKEDSVLTWCAEKGRSEDIVREIIATGVDIHQANSHGHTALTLAARKGNSDLVRVFLEVGANPAHVTAKGDTALTWAASSGCVKCVEMLLTHEVDLEQENMHQHTALTLAAQAKEVEIVRMLIAAGANLEHTSAKGDTPLLWAVSGNCTKTTQVLLDAGANLAHTNEHGHTALTLAAQVGSEDCANLLLDVGANPLHITNKRDTALSWAVEKNFSPETIKRLIDLGVDVNLVNANFHTPLTLAAYVGSVETIRLLLEAGADPKHATSAGDTALFYAAAGGHIPICKLLLEGGADISHRNSEGRKASAHARARSQPEAAKFLKEWEGVEDW